MKRTGCPASGPLDRTRVASLIGSDVDEIIFTAGGTESDNTAILCGALSQKEKGIGVDQNIFAIIQGGTDKEFRKMSAEQLCALTDYDGFAIGGLSVGEPNQDAIYPGRRKHRRQSQKAPQSNS